MWSESTRKILGVVWSQNLHQKTTKVRNLESSPWAWKSEFCSFHTFIVSACVWSVRWTWINVRCIALISGNMLSTKSVTRKCVEKFLESFKVETFTKKWQKAEILNLYCEQQTAVKKRILPFSHFLGSGLRLRYHVSTN